jgi:hypothetical protein
MLSVAAPAHAAQRVTAGRNTCTVTALSPVLSRGSLIGTASVVCTLATALTIEIGVAEIDGASEDIRVPIPPATRTMAVRANQTVVVNTLTVLCANTEVGNEEYATKTRVSISGIVSAFDKTTPRLDSFAC